MCVCVCVERERQRDRVCVKELAHGIIKAWQVQNLQVGPAARRPRKELQFKCEGSLLAEFPFPGGQNFFLIKAFH